MKTRRIKRRGPYGGAEGAVEACGSGTCATRGGKREKRQEGGRKEEREGPREPAPGTAAGKRCKDSTTTTTEQGGAPDEFSERATNRGLTAAKKRIRCGQMLTYSSFLLQNEVDCRSRLKTQKWTNFVLILKKLLWCLWLFFFYHR